MTVIQSTEDLQLTREEILNVINFLHLKINETEINGNINFLEFPEVIEEYFILYLVFFMSKVTKCDNNTYCNIIEILNVLI